MVDDKKKPAGSGGRGRGPNKPFAGRDGGDRPAGARSGEKKPFQRQDGAKRAFGSKDGSAPRQARPGKWERREEGASAGGGDRPRFDRPREDRPFRERDGEKRPYAARGGDAPRPPRGDRPQGDRPRFDRPREDRPFRERDGEKRPYAARDGDAPRAPRGDRPQGDRSRFEKRDGDKRPFRARDDEKRPFRGRDGDKPRPFKRDGDDAAVDAEGERIAKRLARAGVASRRDAESLIADGRIRLNGKVLTTPAVNVKSTDKIELDGKEIPAIERTRLFLFHKPAGVVTTSRDPEGRKTVFDVLPAGLPRLMTVGRLDINTEGLLLLTNDGGLARVLELPTTGWLRRYRVRVHGKVDPKALEGLKDGIAVDGVFYGSIEATFDREQGSNAWLTVGFREGKNREVKNVLGALGLDVNRLIRVSYGPFQLGELVEGEVRELKGKMLRDQLGDRLIEESGADFDAPIINAFSNQPVSAKTQQREEVAENFVRPNRKREREKKREDALGRLDTRKPSRGGFGGSGKPGRDREERVETPRARTTNVWMAPGARPVGEKKAAELSERRFAGKPRPQGKPGKPSGGRPFKPGAGPRKPRGDR